MAQPVETEQQAQVAAYWIRRFRERLQLVEAERASLNGIIRELEDELFKYRSGSTELKGKHRREE